MVGEHMFACKGGLDGSRKGPPRRPRECSGKAASG
jgi:hypothetical protein